MLACRISAGSNNFGFRAWCSPCHELCIGTSCWNSKGMSSQSCYRVLISTSKSAIQLGVIHSVSIEWRCIVSSLHWCPAVKVTFKWHCVQLYGVWWWWSQQGTKTQTMSVQWSSTTCILWHTTTWYAFVMSPHSYNYYQLCSLTSWVRCAATT